MKTTKLFCMAALALMTAACSNTDNEIVPAAEGIPFSATVKSGETPTSRALTLSGSVIEASWAVGEKVAVIHGGIIDEMTVESVDGGTATITGELKGSVADGDAVTVIYPSSAVDPATGDVAAGLLSSDVMDGSLESISTSCDVRKATGVSLKVTGGIASFSSAAVMKALFCVIKLTIKDLGDNDYTVTKLEVCDESNNILATVNAPSATNVLYLSFNPGAATILKFFATKPNSLKGTAYTKVSATKLEPKFYQTTLKFARINDYILKSGSFADGQTDTTPADVVARIAYIGREADAGHPDKYSGLAFARGNASVSEGLSGAIYSFVWCDKGTEKCLASDMDGIENTKALAAHATHNHAAAKAVTTYAVAGFTPSAYGFSDWFLASNDQVERCALYRESKITNLKKARGMSGDGYIYWTSSEQDEANSYKWDEYPMFSPVAKTTQYKMAVRPCLAF